LHGKYNEVNNGSHLLPKIVNQPYLELWTKQAHSLKEGKLRTYLKIKTNFGYENYLSIVKNFEQRRRLSKLRISAWQVQ
jgi:hypothetical protein